MTETAKLLENINNSADFEMLVNSVLRMAEPKYKAIIETGRNVDGKTVKSPVDGIYFLTDSVPPTVILIHHSTFLRKDLEKKWLYDNSAKKDKTQVPDGDVIKTIKWIENERKRIPDLKAILVLTTNRIPSESLIKNTASGCINNNIEVDIWDNSRLQHFLDNEPNGQWLRKEYLRIEQKRISKNLIDEISDKNLKAYSGRLFIDSATSLIDRTTDKEFINILENNNIRLTLLVAESGFGKSISCFRLLENHIKNGGYGLWLPDEILTSSITMENAIFDTMKSFHRSLEDSCADDLFKFASSPPFLMIIDDVNRLPDTEKIINKIISWLYSADKTDTESIPIHSPRISIICPIWPQKIKCITEACRKNMKINIMQLKTFTSEESIEAIHKSRKNETERLSKLEIKNISERLGNDPLLINLCSKSSIEINQNSFIQPHTVISQYIKDQTRRLSGSFLENEYLSSLSLLSEFMLKNKEIEPKWEHTTKWFDNQASTISQLRELLRQQTIISFDERRNCIIFRHDRVRDYFLTHYINDKMNTDSIDDQIIDEPFYSEFIGNALILDNIDDKWIDKVKSHNSLALFYALKSVGEASSSIKQSIVSSINNLIDNQNKPLIPALKNAIEFVLSDTDSEFALGICNKLSGNSWRLLEAKFRNGDLIAGAEYCLGIEISCGSPRRDMLIEHIYKKHGKNLVKKLSDALICRELNQSVKIGLLNLAGFISDRDLIPSIEKCWQQCEPDSNILLSSIWAASRCCADDAEKTLKPMFDYWEKLPDKEDKNGVGSELFNIAQYGLRHAFFHHSPQDSAILYFINRALSSEKLRWAITLIMQQIDNPDAIEFVIRQAALIEEKIESSNGFSFWLTMLEHPFNEKDELDNKKMGNISQNRLEEIWSNQNESNYVRKQAMQMWIKAIDITQLNKLRDIPENSPIFDVALIKRMMLGDLSVEDAVIKKLRTVKHPDYWLQFCHHCWTDKLNNEIGKILSKKVLNTDNKIITENYVSNNMISQLLIKIPIKNAESHIIKNWEQLKSSQEYIQAALYVGTESCLKLVAKTIQECGDPNLLFEYIDQRFGFMSGELKSYNDRHLRILEPYLDYFSDMSIWSFWMSCNRRGFFSWREKHLDKRLSEKFKKREHHTVIDSAVFEQLDRFVEDNRKKIIVSYDFWLKSFEERGETIRLPMKLLREWLYERKSSEAFHVAAYIISIGGIRSDLEILKIDIPNAEKSYIAQIREDTTFAVKLRSLQ